VTRTRTSCIGEAAHSPFSERIVEIGIRSMNGYGMVAYAKRAFDERSESASGRLSTGTRVEPEVISMRLRKLCIGFGCTGQVLE
jgi:hypothetical protein